MKLVIAGGRDRSLSPADMESLRSIHAKHRITEVVSGGASGVDSCGESWAASNGIPVRRFPALWSLHGRAAGPIRNRTMAQYADAVAVFPGGSGTRSMKAEAVRAGCMVFDFTSAQASH